MKNDIKKWKVRLLFSTFILLGLFLWGCEKPKSKKVFHPPPLPEEKWLPVDYVFLIDNSGSIPRGEARKLVSEAIQTIIELAQRGDKISIILFDEGSQVIAGEVVENEAARKRLRQAVASELNFEGKYTDISRGMSLLRNKQASLFRGAGVAKPVIILISDGNLEPKGKNVKGAYRQLEKDWHFLSDTAPIYTLGLGETAINKEFLPGLTGFKLLNQMAETSRGKFYPVTSVEELAGTCTKVLRVTKGYGELADQKIYWTDESTALLAFLVLKRLPSRQICRTADIRLVEPMGGKLDFSVAASSNQGPNRIRWTRMEYFDLILIDQPAPGEWSLMLESGALPRVVTLIRNTVHLRYLVQDQYWDREKKILMAWLYDERTEKLADRKCGIRAAFDLKTRFKPDAGRIDLHKNNTGAYLATLTLGEKEVPSGEYLLKIMAEDEGGFFFRQSPTIPVKVKDAFFSFQLPKGNIPKWPFLWKGTEYGVDLKGGHPNFPSFRDTPDVSLLLTKIEEGENLPLPSRELIPERTDGGILFRFKDKNLEVGQYVASILMKGRLTSGQAIRVESPESVFDLFFPYWVWIGVGVIGICGLIGFSFLFRPRLSGKLNFIKPPGRSPIVLTKNKKTEKSIRGDTLRLGNRAKELQELQEQSFSIHALRGKRLRIRVKKGAMKLTRAGETRSVSASDLYRGDQINFTDGGTEYMIEVINPKRPPGKKR